jgi:hypothetical protein
VEGSFEHGNEPPGSINLWEVLEVVPQLTASQEGPSSMKLVSVCRLRFRGLYCT